MGVGGMSLVSTQRDLSRWQGWVARDGLQVCYTATLFLSALLMFSVQPMFAKLVLPKLGGSPSVWAVSMCFFQLMLLAGYGYAYVLNRFLPGRVSIAVHLGLLLVAAFALPFGLPQQLAEPPAGDAYLWLMGLLTLGVGLPFFAIAGNAPLLQAWFARTGHRHANDPYFLYRASNIGSLLALFAYPLLLEPGLGLLAQSRLWSVGFGVLGVLIAACGWLLVTTAASATVPEKASAAAAATETPSARWSARATWVMLSFLPSGLIVAVTTFVTTDMASAPFLWVVPLALFLLTFVLVFQETLPFNYNLLCQALPAAVLAVILTQSLLICSVFALLAFFLAALVCHRELYLRRPASDRLTEFYLWMSFGGVLGGVFSALIAPHIFKSVFEFHVLALLALLFRPGIALGREVPLRFGRMALIIASGLVLMLGFNLAVSAGIVPTDRAYLLVLVGALCLGLFLIRNWPEHRAAMVLTMIAAVGMSPGDFYTLHVERSFFGTHRVTISADGTTRLLLHGTTIHGAQVVRDAKGQVIETPVPATYYYPGGPMARGLTAARAATSGDGKPLRVGVVGLGAGSLACYSRPTEAWRFFEIDPAVARIATDPALFSFLPRCQPKADIVIGDARLTVSKEAPGSFGYLVIDAFSSDSIPVHLMTAEAIAMLAGKLDANGIMALHVSNRHLDLVPALTSTIAQVPNLSAVLVEDLTPPSGVAATASQVVFLAHKPGALAHVAAWPNARALTPSSAAAWTDDYSGVLAAMIRKLRG